MTTRTTLVSIALLLALPWLGGCPSAEDTFKQGLLPTLCDESFYVCNVSAGCVLEEDYFLEGVFPGTRRVILVTDEPDTDLRVRIFLKDMMSPGTEFLLQIYEPNCTLDTYHSRIYMADTDLFDEAGDDRTLDLDLQALDPGEHLLEMYSDASTGYLLTVERP